MRSIQHLTDPDSKTYPRLKRVLQPVSIAVVICFIVFAYLANITIDEADAAMYATLDGIFWFFCALLPFALAAIVFLIVVHAKRNKIYYSRFNRSRLNK